MQDTTEARDRDVVGVDPAARDAQRRDACVDAVVMASERHLEIAHAEERHRD